MCPSDKGVYTHKHVLFTNAFFDLMRRENLFFPKGINAKVVEDIASYHHKQSVWQPCRLLAVHSGRPLLSRDGPPRR